MPQAAVCGGSAPFAFGVGVGGISVADFTDCESAVDDKALAALSLGAEHLRDVTGTDWKHSAASGISKDCVGSGRSFLASCLSFGSLLRAA